MWLHVIALFLGLHGVRGEGNAFEIVSRYPSDPSNPHLVEEGRGLTLHCEVSTRVSMCTWSRPGGDQCALLGTDTGTKRCNTEG